MPETLNMTYGFFLHGSEGRKFGLDFFFFLALPRCVHRVWRSVAFLWVATFFLMAPLLS